MKRMQKILLTVLSGGVIAFLPAEDEVKPETLKTVYQMPPIIVIGERVSEPTNSSFIPKAAIEELKTDKISDLLSELAGVSVTDYGGIGGVQSAIIRTTGSSSRSLVLLNGRPANDPYNGGFNLNLIAPNLLDQVTLYRGPFSHLFGRDALGGLIALTTKSLNTGKPYSKAEIAAGSFGTNRLQFDFGRSLIRNTSFYFASDILTTQGFRDSSAARLYSLSGNVSARFSENFKMRWDLLFHQDSIQTPGQDSALFPANKKEWAAPPGIQKDKRWDGDLILQLPAATQAVAFYTNSRLDYSDRYSSSGHRYQTYGINLSKDFKFGVHETGFGFDVQNTNASSSEITERSLLEGGGSAHYRFNRYPVIAAATLRFDRLYTKENAFNPALKLGYWLRPGVSVYAGFGRSFRSPTITELYWPTDTIFRYRGNPHLKSESGISYELGTKIKYGWLNFEAAVFEAHYKNLITTSVDTENYLTKLNFDSVTTRGVEGTLAIEPFRGCKASASYSQFWADTALPYTPGYRVFIALEYRHPFFEKKVEPLIRFETEMAGNRFDPFWWSVQQEKLPSYAVYNCLAWVKIIDLTICSRLNNLLDSKYELIGGYPMPPREWKMGVAWEFWD